MRKRGEREINLASERTQRKAIDQSPFSSWAFLGRQIRLNTDLFFSWRPVLSFPKPVHCATAQGAKSLANSGFT